MITIRLAGEPKGKGRPRFVRTTGRAYTPQATRSHEAALRWAAQEEMRDRPPLVGPLVVIVAASFGVPKSFSKIRRLQALSGEIWPTKKPDIDNVAKTFDALNGIVWVDDSQIVDCRIIKTYALKPQLEIQVGIK